MDVRLTEWLGRWPLATAVPAEPTPSAETGTAARKEDLFFASDNWFKAVAGRPLKNVADKAEQGSPAFVKPASKPDLPLAAEGRTAQHGREAELQSALALWFIRMRLTFEVTGGRQWAKPAVGRPVD